MFADNDDVSLRLEEHSKFGAKFCYILALASVGDLCILEGSLVDSEKSLGPGYLNSEALRQFFLL